MPRLRSNAGWLPSAVNTSALEADRASRVTEAEFARRMTRCGGFEPGPHLAVAVSGGADSLALALLADRWARRRGGRITALTVDHGLRAGSAAEAVRVKSLLAARGIAHHTLRWRGAKPAGGAAIQAAARDARYRLMRGWCRRAGVLHLLLGHHRADQAETVLLRMLRRSGPDGLAGMAATVSGAEARLVRPLLDIAPTRLRATCRAAGLDWIEDPSNRDLRHLRVQMREVLPILAEDGMTIDRLGRLARIYGLARATLDTATAELLAESAAVYPGGYAILDPGPLAAASPTLRRRALASVIRTIGGNAYPPRGEALDRLTASVAEGKAAATLGGCVVAPRRVGVLVRRESARIAPLVLEPGLDRIWDGRFRVTVGRLPRAAAPALTVAPLGKRGWAALLAETPEIRAHGVPGEVGPVLPAIRSGETVLAVPHVGYAAGPECGLVTGRIRVAFAPAQPLAADIFSVV